LSGLAMIVGAPAAFAQNAAPAQQDAAAISDSDIQAYASVAAKLNTIQADASLSEADKNAKMVAAVKDSGMDTDKFNAITTAARTDPQVRRKIQEAMGK
jgi:hypothetical protein